MSISNETTDRITVLTDVGELVIEHVAYHRNGVGGVGFHVVLFAEPTEERRMLGIVYPLADGETWNGLVSVFNRVLLAQDNIAFGENSWRGDHYEHGLRQAIALWDAARKEGA